jgi:hypothetical protein
MKKLTLLLVISSACAIHSASANLIANGNFSSGNTGFTSDYSYVSPNTAEGQYYVLSGNANTWNGGFSSLVGYGGSGNYLIANGSADNTKSPWAQTVSSPSVTLTTDTNSPVYYRFEAQIANLFAFDGGLPAPDLAFEISVDGGAFNKFTATPFLSPGSWNLVYADTYLTSAPSSLSFRLRNQSTDLAGNDFGVDSIYFGLTTAAPSYPSSPILSAGNIANPTFVGPSAAVPEPGTWAAAALLLGGAGFARWRRRAKTA